MLTQKTRCLRKKRDFDSPKRDFDAHKRDCYAKNVILMPKNKCLRQKRDFCAKHMILTPKIYLKIIKIEPKIMIFEI